MTEILLDKMKSKTKKLFALLTGFIFYLILGGFVFEAVEHGQNTGEKNMLEIFHKIKAAKGNLTRKEFNAFLLEIQSVHQKTNYGSKWTFYSSMYFCGSVVTTIGRSLQVQLKHRCNDPSNLYLLNPF